MTSEFENEDIRNAAQRLCDRVRDTKVAGGEERNLRYALQVLETHASSAETAMTVATSLMGELLATNTAEIGFSQAKEDQMELDVPFKM